MNSPFLSVSGRNPFDPRTNGSVCNAPMRKSSFPQQGHMTFFSIAMIPFCELASTCSATKKHSYANKVSKVVPATGIGERIDSVVSEYPGKETEQDQEAMNQSREETRRVICSNRRLRGATRKQCRYCTDGKQWNESSARPIHCETPNVLGEGPAEGEARSEPASAACRRSPRPAGWASAAKRYERSENAQRQGAAPSPRPQARHQDKPAVHGFGQCGKGLRTIYDG